MTSVANVGSTTSSSSASGTTTAQDVQDRFLKLLVTQMKNQDPLNPLDNAQITSQMAQLSTVTGIEQLNDTLSAYTKAQSFQAVNLIGHTVLAPGNDIQLSSSKGAAGFELASAADTVKVSVLDSSGNLVKQLDLGAQNSGLVAFSWDGTNTAGETVADGTYTYKVAASSGGTAVSATSLALGTVGSVLMDGSTATLNVSGIGSVDLADIRQVI